MGRQGDFMHMLREQGYSFDTLRMDHTQSSVPQHDQQTMVTQGTTVLAFKYQDGVIVGGDRRATAGMSVMYDRTDKVLELDRFCVMAIAGVPATAFEMARILEHSFKYYRRSQLQDLSFEGKLRALTKLLKENAPAALAGTGTVAPVFAGFDQERRQGKIFFYDILGAEFEGVDYAVSGSGSPTIRGILHYLHRWGDTPLYQLPEEQAIVLIMRLLSSAAEFDAATGGINYEANLFPIVKRISSQGVEQIASERLKELCESQVMRYV
ncbi:MAG: proteasome subunit beta [Nitrospirales bacterium]|nr:MAG: proteasome subunit beta [Nitrospirales bacterium]